MTRKRDNNFGKDGADAPVVDVPDNAQSPGLFGDLNATRRAVVGSLLAAMAVVAGRGRGVAATLKPSALPPPVIAKLVTDNPRTRIVRPDDFLFFEVEYVNIAPVGDPPTELQRIDDGKAAYLIVHHQGQAIAEQAYQELAPADDTGTSPEATNIPPSVAQARLAGESRVAFVMPEGASIPYSLPGLLDAFETWEMSLDANAQPAPVDFLLSLLPLFKFNLQPSAGAGTTTQLSPDFNQLKPTLEAPRKLTAREFFNIYRRAPQPGDDMTAPIATPPPTLFLPGILFAPGPPHEPGKTVTAIELPYRLVQSPLPTGGWSHEAEPITHNERTEVWHTRLGTRTADAVDDRSPEPVRAIWSPDYPIPTPTTPFTQSLDGIDRQMLVRLMSGYDEKTITGGTKITVTTKAYKPKPAIANRLMLSALGGWLLEDGNWAERPIGSPKFGGRGVDLTQWNHRAAMARDYYVRVVYAGFLFPYGHAASLVKVTERKFEDDSSGEGRLAVLRQRFFIIVRQRTRLYQHPNQAFQGRDLPFARIDCLTTTTPDIAKPTSEIEPNPELAREVFWPIVGEPQMPGTTNDLQFQMVGYDHAGRAIPFTSPAMFISVNRNNPDQLAPIIDAYNGESIDSNTPHRRARPFNGATIQLAPDAGTSGDGDTNVPTDQIAFIGAGAVNGGVPSTTGDPEPAQFFPGTDSILVRLPAVQKLLGSNAPVNAKISDAFKGADPAAAGPGFDPGANPGQVFLDLVDAASTLDPGVPSDKGGGLVNPSITPKSLSRTLGAVGAQVASDTVGEVTEFAKGNFDPKQFIPDINLLGVVPLSEILEVIVGLDNAPKLVNQELPDKIVVSFNIHQENLKEFPAGSPLFVPNADGEKSVFDITSTIVVPRPEVGAGGGTPVAPQATVDGYLSWFKINLFGCIVITFDKLAFSSKPGSKPDVTVDINKDHGVLFKGPLEFVNELKKYIPTNGFSDPPNLAVTPAGITASYSLALPAITVGVMTLQNITIGAGFDLPFDGKAPSARFNFAERHNPFNLTISLLGGGGFVALSVSTEGVQEIEAQLEFGAFAAIDLGVASGSAYIKGGFHFIWSAPKKSVELEAFIEIGGHLSVLGLISVTITFHVGLTYHEISDPKSNELVGQATLTVEIELLFFSKSVEVSVEKRFAGSARDPRFIDFISEPAWKTYCAAFA